MKRYEMKQYASDPFDVMCGDCPVHEIEYWQEVTEDELKEEHLYQLGADASMPDFEREMMQAEGNWWPTPEKYEDWLAECIKDGCIREVA